MMKPWNYHLELHHQSDNLFDDGGWSWYKSILLSVLLISIALIWGQHFRSIKVESRSL